jgi:galactokinase
MKTTTRHTTEDGLAYYSETIINGTLTTETADRMLKDATDKQLIAYTHASALCGFGWDQMSDNQRIYSRASNEIYRRARVAAQEQEREAERQETMRVHRENDEAVISKYEAAARNAFSGTEREFDRVWPQLREKRLIELMEERLGTPGSDPRVAANHTGPNTF